MKHPSPQIHRAAMCSLLAAALVAPSTHAATQTWANTGSNDFNSGAAWLSGTAPVAGDIALFSGTSVLNPVLNSSLSIATLSFTGGTNNYGYTLSSNAGAALTLTGGTIISIGATNSSGTNTISSNLVLGGAINSTQTISVARAGHLVISGNISETNANTRLSFAAPNSGITQDGIVTLSGSNSFTGGMTFSNNAFRLNVNNAHALGTGIISGTSIGINLDNTSGSAITIATNNAFNVGNSLTFGTGSTPNNDLNLGTGAVTLLGATGATQIITVTGTSLLTIGGVIGEQNAGVNMLKGGAGTVFISGTANTYTGVTTGSAGVLQVSKLANGGVASSIGQSSAAASNLVFTNAGTLRYVGGGDSTDRNFTIVNGGSGAVIESSGSGALLFTSGTLGHGGTLTSARTLNLGGTYGGTNTFATVITNASGGGVTSLTKTGSGRWIVSGVNSYTGATTISDGVLEAIDGIGLPTGSTLQLRGGVFQSNGTFTRNVSTAAGGVNWSTSSGGFAARGGTLNVQLNNGTGSVTWNGTSFVQNGQSLIFGSTSADSMVDFQNAINLGSSGTNIRTITVIDNVSSATDVARISGAITNTTSGQSLAKAGNGVLELTANNTYSGTTFVNAGTLVLSGTLSATTAVNVASGATLVVNGLTNGGAAFSVSGRLAGNGTVGGATTITGSLGPGNSEGLLSFSNALTLSGNTANTIMEITGLSRGVLGGYDAINVGASQLLTYDGTLTLTMAGLIADGTYDLFSFTAGFDAGGFDAISFAGGAYSGTWTESIPGSGVWTASSGGQNFTFTESTGDLLVGAVPEPSAVLLFGAAGTFLLIFRRRNSKA